MRARLCDESAMELSTKPKATSLSSVHYQLGVTCRELNELDRAVDHFQQVDNPVSVALSQGDILCELEACYSGGGSRCPVAASRRLFDPRPRTLLAHAA